MNAVQRQVYNPGKGRRRMTGITIFCRVIDNFGDIGVTWRLARMLSRMGISTELFVDRTDVMKEIVPELRNAESFPAVSENVLIREWTDETELEFQPGTAVIEAFSCRLSDLTAEKIGKSGAVWINLDYLTAESWADDCHGLMSMDRGVSKYFYYQGFSAKTGGLNIEPGQRELDIEYRGKRAELLSGLGLSPSVPFVMTLFSYENDAVYEALLGALGKYGEETAIIAPEGRGASSLMRAAESSGIPDNVTVKTVPLTSQDGYDRLLSIADLNIVRGEDSFLRAQAAGVPMIWHIYPQDDDAHLIKLASFLDRMVTAFSPDAGDYMRSLNMSFTTGSAAAFGSLMEKYGAYRSALEQGARIWSEKTCSAVNLAAGLVTFIKNKLKYSASAAVKA